MSNRPVTSISARKRGTTRFLTGSTPSTCSASSSSRILRAPRSAVIAVPATPASTIGVDERRELADRGEHEEAAEAVERAEQDEEVRRLQARRAVAERDRRDQQREPAQPQREQELADELAAVRVRRTQGRHDRLPRQDHHVPDLFEQVLRGKKRSVGDAIGPSIPSSDPGLARPHGHARGGTLVLQADNERRARNWRLRPPIGATVPRAVEGPRALRLIAAPAAALVVLGTAACGGGASQDADEPSGTYRVAIVRSSFPVRQHVAAPTRLMIDVRNTGRKTVPNVAVTVDAFSSPASAPTSPTRSGRSGSSTGRPRAARPPTRTRGRSGRWPPARRSASSGT